MQKLSKFSEEFYLATEDDANLRIDLVLVKHPNIRTRSRAAKLLTEKFVSLKNKPVKASYKVRAGDKFSLKIPIEQTNDMAPFDFALDIYFEDSELIVVNKPAGMVVHPSAGHHTGKTLVNALLAHCKNLSMGFGENRPGIVHRLDKDTSGLLVVAKNDFAHEFLARQFKEKSALRVYKAIVYGHPPKSSGVIESYLIRHPVHRKKFCSSRAKDGKDPEGKLASTNYKVIAEFFEEISLLECRLQTGRTHQIRIHLSELGYPIVADPIYSKLGREKNLKHKLVAAEIRSLQRIGLHACELGFVHPTSNELLKFKCPWPADLLSLVEKLRFTSW